MWRIRWFLLSADTEKKTSHLLIADFYDDFDSYYQLFANDRHIENSIENIS